MLRKKQQTSQLSSVSRSSGLLFASTLALGLLVGCGGSEPNSTEVANDKATDSVAQTAETEAKTVEAPEATVETEAEVAEPAATETSETEPVSEADDSAQPEAATAKEEAPLDAAAGAELYEKACKACHGTGLLSSPKLGDKEAWAPRIAKGKETLYQHSANGFNSMPAQASGDITEAQVHAAVDYMIEQSS